MSDLARRFYVYLLRDPRDGQVFYVGKGTGARADDHRRRLARAKTEMADAQERGDHGAKLRKLAELERVGREPDIDVILDRGSEAIVETRALDIEAALIAVFRLDYLTNEVKGHDLKVVPARVFDRARAAKPKELGKRVRAVVVPVDGTWGGADFIGSLLTANDEDVWENARHTWAPRPKAGTAARLNAGSVNPVVLIALGKDPRGVRANIVHGVFELVDARPSTDPNDLKGGYTAKDGHYVEEYQGWCFERTTEKQAAAVVTLRKRLIGNTLIIGGAEYRRPQAPSHVGAW